MLHWLSDGFGHFLVLGVLHLFFRDGTSLRNEFTSGLHSRLTCVFKSAILAVLLLFQLALAGVVLLAGTASIEDFSEVFQVRQKIEVLTITARARRTTRILRRHLVVVCKNVMILNGIRKKVLVEAFSERQSTGVVRRKVSGTSCGRSVELRHPTHRIQAVWFQDNVFVDFFVPRKSSFGGRQLLVFFEAYDHNLCLLADTFHLLGFHRAQYSLS